jgi:hypothetical protein
MDKDTKIEVGGIIRSDLYVWEILKINKDSIYAKELKTCIVSFYSIKSFSSSEYVYTPPPRSTTDNITLRVGDTFINSAGSLVKIDRFFNNGYKCVLSSKSWRITDNKITSVIKDYIKNGFYTNYKPVDSETMKDDEWIPKVGDWATIMKDGEPGFDSRSSNFHLGNLTFQIGYISDKSWKRDSFLCKEKNDVGNGVFFGRVRKALPHEIPTEQSTIKEWKKEDFYNTKIIVDTPEKSKKFQELILDLGLKWCGPGPSKIQLLHCKCLFIRSGERNISKTDHLDKHFRSSQTENLKEIFYDEIFNNNSITTTKTIKQNGNKESSRIDLHGKNHPVRQGKTIGRIGISSRRQQITVGSRPQGNITRANTTKASIRRVEICGNIGFRSNLG